MSNIPPILHLIKYFRYDVKRRVRNSITRSLEVLNSQISFPAIVYEKGKLFQDCLKFSYGWSNGWYMLSFFFVSLGIYHNRQKWNFLEKHDNDVNKCAGKPYRAKAKRKIPSKLSDDPWRKYNWLELLAYFKCSFVCDLIFPYIIFT